MRLLDRGRLFGLASEWMLGEAEFQRLKQRDFRRSVAWIGVLGALLVAGLWSWDWTVDPAHAPETLPLRLLLAASLLVYPAALLAGATRMLSLIFYGLLLWMQVPYMWILARLDGGAVHGVAGFMLWFIVPPLMGLLLRLRDNIAGNFAVIAFPSVLVSVFGLLPDLDLRQFNALLVPAGLITIVGHTMMNRLLRHIYEYRWQLEWRSLAIDKLVEAVLIVQQGIIRYANRAAAQLLGTAPAKMVGFPLRDFIGVDKDTDLSLPLRVGTADGGETWVRLNRAEIVWHDLPATLLSGTDVSAQLSANQALRQSDEKYRALVDHASEGIAIIQDDRFVYVNPRLSAMVGYSAAELEQMPEASRIIHGEDRQAVVAAHARRMAGENVDQHCALRFVGKTGDVVWCDMGTVTLQWLGRPASLAFFSDLSERKRLEQELMTNLAERETILDTAVVGITFLDSGGRVVWANKALRDMFGGTREEYPGRSLSRLFVSHDRYVEMRSEVSARASTGQDFQRELPMRRADGSSLWVHVSGRAVNRRDFGQGTVWTLTDITRRVELEQQLRRKTVEQEIILQCTQIGIAHTAGRVHQWVNRAFADMLGFSVEELIGKSSLLHFPDLEAWRELGEAAYPVLASGGVFSGERRFKRKSGEIFPVQMLGQSADPDEPGKGAIWTVVDLTEVRRLEEEVRRTSAEREIILQSTQIGITFSINRIHKWVNRTFADMVGYSEEELLGASSSIHFPSDEAWRELGDEAYPALSSGEPYCTECQMRRKDGVLIWTHLFGKAVDPTDLERGTIWTFVDVTKRRQAEEDTRRALEQQKELNQLKSRFVSMTSHEFRTPLATILSSVELLRYYSDRMPEAERVELIASVEGAVARMVRMLDNVLVIGRVDSGNMEFSPAACLPGEVFPRLAAEAARAASGDDSGARRLAAEFDGSEARLMLDEKLIRHIVDNLIGNAFKYSAASDKVGFSVAVGAREIVLAVADRGIGIPAEDLPRLFDAFHRARNVGNVPGTGLGLAIVKRAVDLHGGSISVDSGSGTGTRFTVRLPRVEA